jgi:chromosome segregation ATPase
MSNETETPRTDAAEPQLHSNAGGWVRADFARELERELNESQAQSHGLARRVVEAETKLEVEIANRKKCCQDGNALSDELFDRQRELRASQAKIKEIRAALGDDGRRTHNEILELAFKASGWKLWKEKYLDLKNAHIAEGQDPAGTIWEHADKLQKELKASNAEVERLTKELDTWDYGTRAKRERARAEEAEAEVEELQQQIRNCLEIIDDDAKEKSELKDEVAKINHQLLNTESDLIQSQAEVERLRDELELYKAANSDVRRIAEERNKAISLANAALKLLSISEGQWDYNDDTLELTRIESELEVLNPTDK